MAAGRELVERILADAPDAQRPALLARLSKRNPSLAEQLSSTPKVRNVEPPMPKHEPSAHRPLRRTLPAETMPIKPKADSTDPLSALEALDDQSLLRALRHTDRKTVMLALAGASESLMKRIVQDLPRRKANQFRRQVRAIGPTRLSDIVEAQRSMVRCGRA